MFYKIIVIFKNLLVWLVIISQLIVKMICSCEAIAGAALLRFLLSGKSSVNITFVMFRMSEYRGYLQMLV